MNENGILFPQFTPFHLSINRNPEVAKQFPERGKFEQFTEYNGFKAFVKLKILDLSTELIR